jgi:hypothetical protein
MKTYHKPAMREMTREAYLLVMSLPCNPFVTPTCFRHKRAMVKMDSQHWRCPTTGCHSAVRMLPLYSISLMASPVRHSLDSSSL